MESMTYSSEYLLRTVAAGYKGGPFFKSPILHPQMTIPDAVPSEVKAKLMHTGTPKSMPEAPWSMRRNK